MCSVLNCSYVLQVMIFCSVLLKQLYVPVTFTRVKKHTLRLCTSMLKTDATVFFNEYKISISPPKCVIFTTKLNGATSKTRHPESMFRCDPI